MTLTKSWSSPVYVACIALVIPVFGLCAQQDASVPASQERRISFNRPELPRIFVDTSMPDGSGRVIEVPEDGDFQQAIHDARPGDTIVLQAGATYTGTFVFPKKDGDGWIVVKSSAESQLPPPGTRVTPADSKHMPRIVTARNVQPAMRTEHGAHRYRFIGIEFTTAPEVKRVSAIVELSHKSTELDDVPSHFVFDRVYIHGNPELNSQRGPAMNSRWTAVIDSWIDECHIHGFDSQAICTWNGHGPFKIENCFLDNLMTPGSYGVKPDGGGVGWNPGLGSHIRGNSVMKGNTIIRVGRDRARSSSPRSYPDGNLWFDSFAEAGVDPETYRVLPHSKAKGTATDGTDPGADVDAVMEATANVRARRPWSQ